MKKTGFVLLLVLLLSRQSVFSSDSVSINKTRFIALAASVNTLYGASLVYLGKMWYSKSDRTSFHFFNDLPEWKQMDKAGHFTTAFQESEIMIQALKWAGVPDKQAIIWGGMAGFLYQSPIEIFDGFQSTYGASLTDVAANALGSAAVISQNLIWNEIRIQPKFSFHRSGLAHLNPSLLGSGLKDEWLKDYNGQTYWFAANISSFLKKGSRFPKWLNIAFGYGAQQMIFARDSQNRAIGYYPYRQYYLSLDIDFRHVHTNKKWVKMLLYPLNIIHIPFPTLEFNRHGVYFHGLYF